MATAIGSIRRADQDSDYQRFKVDRARIDAWEDGRRQAEQPGTFEWWYFEIRLPLAALVVAFMDKPMTAASGGLRPLVSVRAHLWDGLHGKEEEFAPVEFSAEINRCDVKIQMNTCRESGGGIYLLEFNVPGIKGTVKLEADTAPVRIGTGHMLFENGAADQYLGWIVGVPCGKAEVDCTIGGHVVQDTGRGYHDHNWGDQPLSSAVHHWYWGRAEIGNFTIIFANVMAQPAFGSGDFAEVVLIEGGHVVASGSSGVNFAASNPTVDPVTKKPMSGVINISISTGSVFYMITFASVVSLIRLCQGQAAYHRDLALCTMTVQRGGRMELLGPAFTSFEMVWFGDAQENEMMDIFQQGLTQPAVDSDRLLAVLGSTAFASLPANR